ncbi:MAG: hypothetical protein AAFY88_29630, partial [Acidobacteriota bacterium]
MKSRRLRQTRLQNRRGLIAVLAAVCLPMTAVAQLGPTPLSDLQALGGKVENVKNVETTAGAAFTLYTADSTRADQAELWSITREDGTVRKLSLELDASQEVTGFWPSPSGDRVAYEVIETPFNPKRRLYAVDIAGGPSVPIIGPEGFNSSLSREVKWTDDGDRAVFSATLQGSLSPRLFSSTADGAPAVELTGPIPTQGTSTGEVLGFDVLEDLVIFWGDLETVDRVSLFSAPVDGGARTHLGAALPQDADVEYARIVQPIVGPATALIAALESFTTTIYAIPVAGGALTT